MATLGTAFPLGAMVGGPNGSDPAAQAAFEQAFTRFTQTMGTAPRFMNAYVDQAKPVADWASNASWTAWSWRKSALAQTTTPVIGLPMATNADRSNPDAVFKAFASGQYDEVLRGVVKAWGDQGFKTLYIRPGYEMNVPGMPWYVGADATTRADWVAAFQRIADTVRSVPGVDVKIVWNPNLQNWNASGDVTALYPGDRYVDVVAGDIYSPLYPRDLYNWSRDDGTVSPGLAQWLAEPANRIHAWTYPSANQWNRVSDGQGNGFGLRDMIDFAKAHGKPVAIAETGVGGFGDRGPMDDSAFPLWLASTLAQSGASVAFVNVWDLNPGDGDWRFSDAAASKPQTAAAWARYFGAGSDAPAGAGSPVVAPPPAPPATVTLGTGPDSVVVRVSEDAWKGHAQFTVSVDGKQIGGVQTATAAHATGQTQAFTLRGSFGAGPHKVAVTFLNDAWGGSAAADRNLYVDSVTYAGTTAAQGAVLGSNGGRAFIVGAPAPVDVSPATLGTGPDSVVVRVSEDAWKGHAQFTVSVDGKQIGGVQTATAAHAAGQTQAFTLRGSFGAGPHKVAVTFLNDAWGGSAAADRNLYVDSITYAGTTAAQGAVLGGNGGQSFLVGTPTDTVTTDLNEYTLGAGSGLRGLRFIGEGDFIGTGNELANTLRGGAGADTLDGGAGADTLTGGAGRDGFVFRAGQANGDTVTDFAGALSGESLDFVGYGAGATLTRLSATDFQVSSAAGAVRDTIHLANAPTLVLGDYRFL